MSESLDNEISFEALKILIVEKISFLRTKIEKKVKTKKPNLKAVLNHEIRNMINFIKKDYIKLKKIHDKYVKSKKVILIFKFRQYLKFFQIKNLMKIK
jgi:hypothetical protein